MRDLPAVYPVLDVELALDRGFSALEIARIWLDEGVRFFQLRSKRLPGGALLGLVEALTREARGAGALVIVNDRADLARMGGAAGVHVGQSDLSPVDARAVVGPEAFVGFSTHNDDQVRRALGEPVDYLAVGPVFATASKERPDPVIGLEGVRSARATIGPAGRPLVAIGGITLETARDVLAAGAASVAVISDLFATDPRGRIREFLSLGQRS